MNEPPATPDEQAGDQKMPELGGAGNQPDRNHGGQHQHEEHDAAAEPVGPHAQRQRISEPVSTGIAIRMPNWVSLRPSVCLIGMPITANIIHTMKHTVNASCAHDHHRPSLVFPGSPRCSPLLVPGCMPAYASPLRRRLFCEGGSKGRGEDLVFGGQERSSSNGVGVLAVPRPLFASAGRCAATAAGRVARRIGVM